MNYLQIRKEIERNIGELEVNYPIAYSLAFDFLKRQISRKNIGDFNKVSHPLLSNYSSFRSFKRPRFLTNLFKYLTWPRSEINKKEKILISFSLVFRFPYLYKRLLENYNIITLVTKSNLHQLSNVNRNYTLRADTLFYSQDQNKLINDFHEILFEAICNDKKINWEQYSHLLTSLEETLTKKVHKLSEWIKTSNISQYISAYSDRFEEILLCHAFKKLNLVSKEICHGVNAHSLKYSDNVVPENADILYVWSQQYYDNTIEFTDTSRLKVCGYPKYDEKQISHFQKKYSRKKLITFFSQSTYDIGATTSPEINDEFIAEERRFREALIEKLKILKEKHGYYIRFRYHPGETSANGVDRVSEKSLISKLGFETSTGSLEQDIFESEVCIGVNTSCLYEANILGCHVFQLDFKYCPSVHFKNIPLVSEKDIHKIILTSTSPPKILYKQLLNINSLVKDCISSF